MENSRLENYCRIDVERARKLILKKKGKKRKLKKKATSNTHENFGPKNGKTPGKKHCIDVKCICNIR